MSSSPALNSSVGKKQRSIRNILINPRYQLKYVFWLSLSGLALVGLYSVLVYFYIKENYSILVDLSPMDQAAKAQLYSELTEIIVRISVISIGFLGIVALLGIVLSHRTAGPLYHFGRVFERVRDGDLSARVKLRPGDDFQEVAAKFNQMMDSVAKK
mgnify:CR=1 FL=1